MMRKQFIKFYSKYQELYSKREYEAVTDVLLELRLDNTCYFFDQIQCTLRTAICLLKNTLKNAKSKHVIHIANSYEQFLKLVADNAERQKFLSVLNMFTKSSDLPYLSVIANLKSEEFDLTGWLLSITQHFFRLFDNTVPNADELKNLYLEISRSILFYLNVEFLWSVENDGRPPRQCDFSGTKYFLKKCMTLKCFKDGHDVKQFVSCFGVMKTFIDGLPTSGSRDEIDCKFMNAMKQVIDDLNNLMSGKQVRATLVKDTYVTIARFTSICQQRLIDSMNVKSAKVYFKLIHSMCVVLSQTAYEKTFCEKCTSGIGIHEVNNLGKLASTMYKSVITQNLHDKSIIDDFAKINRLHFCSLSLLSCEKTTYLHPNAVASFIPLVSMCSQKEQTEFMIPVVLDLLKVFRKVVLNDKKDFTDMYVLRRLFDLLKIGEKWKELVRVGFLWISFCLNASERDPNLEYVAYTVAMTQRSFKDTIELQTPYDYFIDEKETFYGLKLADGHDVIEIMLCYLKYANVYFTNLPEINNKICYQLLMLASNGDQMKCLRFFYYANFIKMDSTSNDRLDNQLKRLLTDYQVTKSEATGLLIGAIKLSEYEYNFVEVTNNNKQVSVHDELLGKSPRSIFLHLNLEYERKQSELLQTAKKYFINFVEFYLAKRNADETKAAAYDDEKNYLMKGIKILATHFTVRDYRSDAMDTYMALFKLSKATNDEYGVINSCSFFAENSSDWQSRFHGENLSAILNECYTMTVEQLKKLATLSLRKQNELFYCLLNIVLFYFAENRFSEAKLLLQYVFNAIGGIDGSASELYVGQQNVAHTVNVAQNNSPPKIQYEAVRIKYYLVLFTMITKYNQYSTFSPLIFAEFAMKHARNNLHLTNDETINVPLFLFKLIPDLVIWGLNRYEFVDQTEVMQMTVLKSSIRMGFVRRSANFILLMALQALHGENLKNCEQRISCLEYITLIKSITSTTEDDPNKLTMNSMDTLNVNLNDPLRKEAASGPTAIKSVSPYKVIQNAVESYMCRYLQNHPKKCQCEICHSSYNRYILFQMGCLYARLVHLNESDAKKKQSVFTELYDYWQMNRKNVDIFPRDENFYVVSARFLVWCSHHEWKFEKRLTKAKELLSSALKGLQKVNRYDIAVEQDIRCQITTLANLIDSERMPKETSTDNHLLFLCRPNTFDNDGVKMMPKDAIPTPARSATSTTSSTKTATKIKINLIDILSMDEVLTSKSNGAVKFQIHDDDASNAMIPVTPAVAKSNRGRPKKLKDTPSNTPCTQKRLQHYIVPETAAQSIIPFGSITTTTATSLIVSSASDPGLPKKCVGSSDLRKRASPKIKNDIKIEIVDLSSPPPIATASCNELKTQEQTAANSIEEQTTNKRSRRAAARVPLQSEAKLIGNLEKNKVQTNTRALRSKRDISNK